VDQLISVKYKIVSDVFEQYYLPSYATNGAAGMDLHACIAARMEIAPGQRLRIPVGIALQMPGPHVVGFVYARSGLAWKYGLGLPNGVGVIDSDYTGEIQVLLMNFSDVPVIIEPGDRVAQIVFAPIYIATMLPVDELQDTDRGSGGFGSTGI